uniref:Ras-GAP domain-containing protein n=1 Tax=Gongylonema pulchrum TaxID=637853 RepID=A0A183EEE3_9BILA
LTLTGHKKQLAEIAQTDPEFYKFLKEEDGDLLQFDESDSELKDPNLELDDGQSFEEEEEEKEQGEKGLQRDPSGQYVIDASFVHDLHISLLEKFSKTIVDQNILCLIPDPNLELDDGQSFEEEEEEEKEQGDKGLQRDPSGQYVIDASFVHDLRISLLEKERPEPSVVRRAVVAFTACVVRVGANIEPPNYVINDGAVFESVVRLCFTELSRCLYSLLGPVKIEDTAENPPSADTEKRTRQPHFRRWKKHHRLVKNYLHALSLVALSCLNFFFFFDV